jgi:5-formyltetrahydrofolate cyclo-ligase
MATGDGSEPGGRYSSPPCSAHELAEGFDGSFVAVDAEQRRDVARWRKAERQRLLKERMAHTPAKRQVWSEDIARHVAATAGSFEGRIVSFYWPFRGEPDLRPLTEIVLSQDGSCALPVVVEEAKPLEFRSWKPGDPLVRGVWNIPVPKGGDAVIPDIVLAPVVGFDPDCFRLGNGGGYFDRTLAAIERKPLVIGVGFSGAAIPTIFPQPHDIPMDMIVTENGVVHSRVGENTR